jgi:Ca2+:H+ antiporter
LLASSLNFGPVAKFGLSFLALCPLAVLLGDLTEGLAGWCGPTLGGLLNATLGNATEAIVLVQALRHNLVRVEQAALLGGVLSNMLLVLGLSFLVGGKSTFDRGTAVADIGVLAIAGVAIVLPSVATGTGGVTQLTLDDSRTSALVLLAMYACLLVYTLGKPDETQKAAVALNSMREEEALLGGEPPEEAEEAEELPKLSLFAILGLLVAITVLARAPALRRAQRLLTTRPPSALRPPQMAILANVLVLNIFDVSHALRISSNVVACIFLPVIGNASELVTSVMAAMNGHMNLALGVALGSSCQISLFLLPVAVLFGWSIGVPFSLDFESIFASAFILSVIVGSIAVLDGKGTWLKGAMLLGMYAVFIAALVYGSPSSAAGPQPAPAPSQAPA